METPHTPAAPGENGHDSTGVIKLEPAFERLQPLSEPDVIISHVQEKAKQPEQTPHEKILEQLLDEVQPVDFKSLAFPQAATLKKKLENKDLNDEQRELIKSQLDRLNLKTNHYLILSIEVLQKTAKKKRWGLCKSQDFVYVYNGAYWAFIDKEEFQAFLGRASEKMGVAKYTARFYQFRLQLSLQFNATEYLPTPEPKKESVLINLKNGTFEITAKAAKLRPFKRDDFLTHQLPFDYLPAARAPLFQKFLDRVLPDKDCQKVLAEFLGFVFIRNGSGFLKEEKALVLYGLGANGKSVVFEVVNALLGASNVCSYRLESLTDTSGYYRAMIANKLLNYASEINGKLETALFKQMVSGEPLEARLPHGRLPSFSTTTASSIIL